jgi:hypothetical protein
MMEPTQGRARTRREPRWVLAPAALDTRTGARAWSCELGDVAVWNGGAEAVTVRRDATIGMLR